MCSVEGYPHRSRVCIKHSAICTQCQSVCSFPHSIVFSLDAVLLKQPSFLLILLRMWKGESPCIPELGGLSCIYKLIEWPTGA